MNIAMILFTYNRSRHTNEVLNALSKNTVLPKKLYIFQDGLQEEDHRLEWEKVNHLIKEVNFCPVELVVSDTNKGVAESVVSGVDHVLKNHEAVIVLEDDCVPSVSFNRFMEQCLEKYKANKRVWSISGCTDPVELVKDDTYDVYGCGRTCSHGWGTWKDRWDKFCFDNNFLKRFRNDKQKSLNLAMWGNDCEQMLLANIAGKIDAWDVYWTLLVIENGGICVNPYESLIENIGWDGSGVHCGVSSRFDVKVSNKIIEDFNLPNDIDILPATQKAFVGLYGSYTATNTENKEKVIIYGLGMFFQRYEKEINEQFYIEAFINKRQKGWFAGKKIISLSELSEYDYSKIIIMVQDIQECFHIIKTLIDRKVCCEKIILGHSLYGKYGKRIDEISVLPNGSFTVTCGSTSIKVTTRTEFDNAYEILGEQLYNYRLNNGKKDVILDFGVITGASILYFLNHENVEKVYGYESLEKNYLLTKTNLESYLCDSNKVEIFQYKDSRDTTRKENPLMIENIPETVQSIINKHLDCNIVLKIDCESEGYSILRELSQNELLDKIILIMLKCHVRGKKAFSEDLRKMNFSWWIKIIDDDVEIVYIYRS